MDKNEIIQRLEKIAKYAVHVPQESPMVLSLDDGIALLEASEILKKKSETEIWGTPITLISTDFQVKTSNVEEQAIMEAVHKIGIEIDKQELLDALNNDRRRYEDAYHQGEKHCSKLIEAVRERRAEPWLVTKFIPVGKEEAPICPSCGQMIRCTMEAIKDDVRKPNYCETCGQRLKWE